MLMLLGITLMLVVQDKMYQYTISLINIENRGRPPTGMDELKSFN